MSTNQSQSKPIVVLVVDDSDSNRYFFSHHLRSAGYEVLEASTGTIGIELAEQQPDLILLDVNLPDQSGYDVCASLKQDPQFKRIPIIQTSANFIEAEDHFKGIECGADAYLASPVNPLVLISTVKAWLRVRRADQALYKNLDLLEQEKELRERFVSTLTHDLRTPLTAAKLGAQLLSKKLGENSAEQVIANRVVSNINRTDIMIRDLLDANLIKAGEKLMLKPEFCQLNDTVEEVLIELGSIHGDVFVFKSESQIEGYWDRNAIRRIVENLCNNAVKYGSQESPITVTLKTLNEDKIQLIVHNEGNPISEEDQITMFDPYKRANTARKGGQKGWGLGLTLVKGLVQAHGGEVSVTSNGETGTDFTVSMPVDCRST